jgi:hypothetical protein
MRRVCCTITIAAVIGICAVLTAVGPASATGLKPQARPLNGVSFISVCGFSHRGTDDPIVYPGHPGISHDHSFVGNVSTNAFSTLESLRAASTTCKRRGDTAAYWAPTLLVAGAAVPPADAIVYYRRRTDAKLKPFPAGLRIVAGNSHALSPQSILVTYWDCGDLSDVPRSSSVPACGDADLRLTVNFPDCWNGKSLDSADHKSHMAYSRGARCGKAHPVPVPAISLLYRYKVPPGARPADIYLASGSPFSAHADFINAWDQPALANLVSSCLNRYRHCGTGT